MTRKELAVLLLLVALCAIVATASPQFLSVTNVQNVARLVGTYGMFSIGVGIVIITGGIDLSVGSICALLGVLLSMMPGRVGLASGRGAAAVIVLGACLGAAHASGRASAAAALHRHAVRSAALSRRRSLHRRRLDERLRTGRGLNGGMDTCVGKHYGVPMPFVLMCVVVVLAGHRFIDRYSEGISSPSATTRRPLATRASTHERSSRGPTYSPEFSPPSRRSSSLSIRPISPASHGNFYEHLCDCRRRRRRLSACAAAKDLSSALSWARRCCKSFNLVNLLDIPGSLDFAVMGAVILMGATADQLFGRGSAPRRWIKSIRRRRPGSPKCQCRRSISAPSRVLRA